jgi:hypothetical protein
VSKENSLPSIHSTFHRSYHVRTIVCSKVHDAFPSSAVLGGHPTCSVAVTVSLEAAAAAVVWLRECACLSMEAISSQAGRSQSSISEENAGGVDRSLEALGGSVVPVMLMWVLSLLAVVVVSNLLCAPLPPWSDWFLPLDDDLTKIFRASFFAAWRCIATFLF